MVRKVNGIAVRILNWTSLTGGSAELQQSINVYKKIEFVGVTVGVCVIVGVCVFVSVGVWVGVVGVGVSNNGKFVAVWVGVCVGVSVGVCVGVSVGAGVKKSSNPGNPLQGDVGKSQDSKIISPPFWTVNVSGADVIQLTYSTRQSPPLLFITVYDWQLHWVCVGVFVGVWVLVTVLLGVFVVVTVGVVVGVGVWVVVLVGVLVGVSLGVSVGVCVNVGVGVGVDASVEFGVGVGVSVSVGVGVTSAHTHVPLVPKLLIFSVKGFAMSIQNWVSYPVSPVIKIPPQS